MVIQSRTSVLTMVMAMISVMAMIGPNVEAFGGFSLQSHGRKVGSLSLPSPSGLATTKKRLREEYLRMSSNDDGNQKEKPELNSDGTLYDDGGALYDDQVRCIIFICSFCHVPDLLHHVAFIFMCLCSN